MRPPTSATARTFGQVFSGRRRWHEAVGSGDIIVSGPPRLMRALPTWFTWSPWADLTEERAGRPPRPAPVWPRPEVAS